MKNNKSFSSSCYWAEQSIFNSVYFPNKLVHIAMSYSFAVFWIRNVRNKTLTTDTKLCTSAQRNNCTIYFAKFSIQDRYILKSCSRRLYFVSSYPRASHKQIHKRENNGMPCQILGNIWMGKPIHIFYITYRLILIMHRYQCDIYSLLLLDFFSIKYVFVYI